MFPPENFFDILHVVPINNGGHHLRKYCPWEAEKQNQFSRVNLHTYPIQSTLKKRVVDEPGKKLCEREVKRVEEEDKEEKI